MVECQPSKLGVASSSLVFRFNWGRSANGNTSGLQPEIEGSIPSDSIKGSLMAKVTWIDNIPHRMRRGVLVPIPTEWFGQTTSAQQINRRYSKSRIKRIESKQDRAKESAELVSGDPDPNPDPNLRRKRTYWYGGSGRTDKYRSKRQRERQVPE